MVTIVAALHPRAEGEARHDRDQIPEHADRSDERPLTGARRRDVGEVDVEIPSTSRRRPARHVLREDVARAHAEHDDRAEITDERRERVLRPERVRRGDRFAFLPETAVQAADHLRLAIEQRQPLLDIAREPDEVSTARGAGSA